MQLVQLPDHIYEKAKLQALQSGFPTVEEYFADLVTEEDEEMDGFFTPEILADIDKVWAGIEAGEKTYSQEEMDEILQKKLDSWPDTPQPR